MPPRRDSRGGPIEEKLIRFKDLAKFVGGALLAVLLLGWVLRGSDPAAVWQQLLQASPLWLIASVALNIGHNVFRVWRWRALLTPVKAGVPFRPMFAAVIIGYMTTWTIPGRLGELVRPVLLTAKERVPLGPAIGSVVADRMLDAVTVVVLFAAGLWLTPLDGPTAEYAGQIQGVAVVLVVLVAVGLGMMLLASMVGADLLEKTRRWSSSLQWVLRTIVSLAQGVHALRSPRLLVQLVIHSLLAWLMIAASTWAGIRAVGIEFPFSATFIILPMIVLGVAVPTPGGAGAYHAALKLGLTLFGVAELAAVSASFLVHAVVTVPVILLGMLLLWTEKVSFKELLASASQIKKLGSSEGKADLGPAVETTP